MCIHVDIEDSPLPSLTINKENHCPSTFAVLTEEGIIFSHLNYISPKWMKIILQSEYENGHSCLMEKKGSMDISKKTVTTAICCHSISVAHTMYIIQFHLQ